MEVSINRIFEHDGHQYHLHCEDLGEEKAAFEVRVIEHGGILWQKRVSYEELKASATGPALLRMALRTKMTLTVQTVEAAIDRGRIP